MDANFLDADVPEAGLDHLLLRAVHLHGRTIVVVALDAGIPNLLFHRLQPRWPRVCLCDGGAGPRGATFSGVVACYKILLAGHQRRPRIPTPSPVDSLEDEEGAVLPAAPHSCELPLPLRRIVVELVPTALVERGGPSDPGEGDPMPARGIPVVVGASGEEEARAQPPAALCEDRQLHRAVAGQIDGHIGLHVVTILVEVAVHTEHRDVVVRYGPEALHQLAARILGAVCGSLPEGRGLRVPEAEAGPALGSLRLGLLLELDALQSAINRALALVVAEKHEGHSRRLVLHALVDALCPWSDLEDAVVPEEQLDAPDIIALPHKGLGPQGAHPRHLPRVVDVQQLHNEVAGILLRV
mmetsp:Transcript_119584/g.334930  ORF Transcript_119584/g.334930 Transcript_119584/m.334930 type:complete len:355 (-) Transcript_119584:542-1606(-)